MKVFWFFLSALLVAPALVVAAEDETEDASLPVHLRDRGTGVPTSMFGTYVRRGELLVYPFFEYYRDRLYLGLEGTQDEVSIVPEIQWHFHRRAFLRLNSAFGLTSKATDWAPEVGIVMRLGRR